MARARDRATSLATQLLPRMLVSLLKRARGVPVNGPSEWELAPDGWQDDTGWSNADDVAKVLDHYRAKLPRLRAALDGHGLIGVPTSPARDVTPTVADQNIVLQFAYALSLASRDRREVAVLDWGGGIGFLSLIATALFPHLAIDYHVKELSVIATAGRALVPTVTFWDDDRCFGRPFDLILASNALQYVEHWRPVLAAFGRTTPGRYVLLQHVPTTIAGPSFAVRQRAYATQFTGWIFGREELLAAAADAGLTPVREFLDSFRGTIPGTAANWESRGYLFRAVG
jgi:putative methyltransferase (TIGR04325 family)